MIADMESNTKLEPIVAELFMRGKKSTFQLFSYHTVISQYLIIVLYHSSDIEIILKNCCHF